MIGVNYNTKLEPTNYILVTDAAVEPVTLDEVKTALRLDGTTDYDALITPLITSVRQFAEMTTGRDMINKTWKTFLDYFAFSSFSRFSPLNVYPFFWNNYPIQIAKSKLQSITSIRYLSNGVYQTYDAANYYISEEADKSSIYLTATATSPQTVDNVKQAVEITFVSGYGATAADVPQGLKTLMINHIGDLLFGDCDVPSAGDGSRYNQYIIFSVV